jgi:serine/threonine-protein kinase
VLYELLTGRPPFVGPTPMAIARQVLADPPVPPTELNPGTPARLSALCLWCLAKPAADRPPSADALSEQLIGEAIDRE